MFDELFGRARDTAGKENEVCDVRDVDNKRIIGGTVLCNKNFPQRFFVEDIRTEPIDRFGRKSDDLSLCDKLCGPLWGLGEHSAHHAPSFNTFLTTHRSVGVRGNRRRSYASIKYPPHRVKNINILLR